MPRRGRTTREKKGTSTVGVGDMGLGFRTGLGFLVPVMNASREDQSRRARRETRGPTTATTSSAIYSRMPQIVFDYLTGDMSYHFTGKMSYGFVVSYRWNKLLFCIVLGGINYLGLDIATP